jgi:hypothetical protein
MDFSFSRDNGISHKSYKIIWRQRYKKCISPPNNLQLFCMFC